VKPGRRVHALLTVNVAMATELRKVPQFRDKSDHEMLSQRGIASNVLLPRRNINEAQTMPFLFWMPMIVMCGLWRAAEEDARVLFPGEH
jgi:hypothetical protein